MNSVKKFLERGKLLSPGLRQKVEELEEEEVEKLLASDSLVVKERDLVEARTPKPEILRRGSEEKEHLHVSDFTNFYLERFNFLKNEILEKMEGEGISSIGNLSSGEASVIGMVREVGDGEVVLEDNTGRLVLNTEERFLEDEVIGARGDVIVDDEGRMRPDKFIYPDVPLRRKVNKADESLRAMFISEPGGAAKAIKEEEPDYVFISKKGEKPKSDLAASVVRVSDGFKETGNFRSDADPVRAKVQDLLFFIHNGSTVKEAKGRLNSGQTQAMISLLKKRHFHPKDMHSLEDRYLLKEVPDIIHVDGEPAMANYKGVTLLSTSEEVGYLVNLKTREVEEVNL